MVKREPGDMVGGILQSLTRPYSRRRDRIGASGRVEHIAGLSWQASIFRLVVETHLLWDDSAAYE